MVLATPPPVAAGKGAAQGCRVELVDVLTRLSAVEPAVPVQAVCLSPDQPVAECLGPSHDLIVSDIHA